MSKAAFEGVNILDFSWAGVGPFSTKYFADHGATVVRVESSASPDLIRFTIPSKDGVPGLNRSYFFAYFNSNKYGFSLNLKHPRSKEVIERLTIWADIVAENFAPGVMERFGLGYEVFQRIKPDIIMYRASNQGQTGPHCTHPGFGTQLVALAGFTNMAGWPDREPVQLGAYTDFVAPPFGTTALIAALLYRRRTGKGQCIDLSQMEASLLNLAPPLLDYTVNGRETERSGNHHPTAAPHAVYPCRGEDSWCAIAVRDDDEWLAFCEAAGKPAWASDPRFATQSERKRNENEVDALVSEWTSGLDKREVMDRLQAKGVAAGMVQSGADLLHDPQLDARGYFWHLEHPELGPHLAVSLPFKLSKTPAKARMPTPCLGEHTEHVCRDMLGMSEEEFRTLAAEGVFE